MKPGSRDEDDAYSDWIEIQNDGTTTVNLAGWALTDDKQEPDKWIFPALTLAPGQFVVVFASGKDRRGVGSPLHTNFSLSSTGEYLALIKPGGAIATEFDEFPEQFADKSYGIGQNVNVTQLVAADARRARIRAGKWRARDRVDAANVCRMEPGPPGRRASATRARSQGSA